VLASASPARLRLLQAAGIDPVVVVSQVSEDDVDPDPQHLVAALARRKARAVAAGRPTATAVAAGHPGGELVLGCDSVLDIDGRAYGKPSSPEEVAARWHRMRGQRATLLTGHHLMDLRSGRAAGVVGRTVVRFGHPTDAEIDAYAATDEPLAVAGAFTLDGRSAAFIDGIEGDPSNVIGLSLPLLRHLARELGVEWTDLWT
jgi:septum formation protein